MEKICQRICLVIYADGFHLHGRFYCRELAFVAPHQAVAPSSVHFKVISPRTRQEHKHVDNVFHHVHGLCLKDEGMDQKELSTYLTTLYQLYQSPERPYIAIKGKNQLHQLFNVLKKELNFPLMDLERLGCPSFEALSAGKPTYYTCGQHSLGKRCAQSMVAYYRQWIIQTIG